MEKLSQVVYYLKEYYPAFVFDCKDYDTLYELMTHDKKNEAGIINFTLLSQVGDVRRKFSNPWIFIVKALEYNEK